MFLKYTAGFLLAALVVFVSSSQAQTVDKKTLTLDGARAIMAAAVADAKAKNAPGGAIAVVDDGGNLLALERLDSTFVAAANAGQMFMAHAHMSTPAEVTFIESARVAAAFAKGMPLLEVNDYKIHASRREASGMAEIHARDTDIIYVLDGTATFVTGGTAVEATTVAPEEIRGKTIQGGQSRQLVKGDVIVLPNGVAHLFQDVKGPFTYYVVKVRATDGGAK